MWALAKVCGTFSGGSQSRKLVNKHGIAFRPATANEAHANSKNKSEFLPHVNLSLSRSLTHVIFSFFVPGCCCYGTTAVHQAYLVMTPTNGSSACGLVSMRACARGVNHVMLLSANLYYIYPYVAYYGKFLIMYGSARGIKYCESGISFEFSTPLAAAVFQVQQQLSSRQKG